MPSPLPEEFGVQLYGQDGSVKRAVKTDPDGNIIVTSADPIDNILNSISDAAQRLAFLAGCRGIAADLRVTILSGVVTQVTTVSNITSFGGNTAINIVPNMQNILYNNAIMTNIGVV